MTISSCNACGGALSTRYAEVTDPQSRETFAVAECSSCRLGHTTPQPVDLPAYYGPDYHGGRHGMTALYCAKRRLRLVESVATAAGRDGGERPRRLLDVGCGDGTFLLAAKRKEWEVAGTEMNPHIARAAGLDVRESAEQFGPDARNFDCVTLWHSLEHMRDPRGMIESLSGLLAPGGLLVIAVPDAGGLQARAFGPHWFHLDVPRHLYHFSTRSLSRLLETAGFSVVRSWNQEFEYDVLGWSQSALNVLMPAQNVFFKRLTGQPVTADSGQVLTSYLLGVGLSALSLPFVTLGTLSRRGGTLIAVARRRDETFEAEIGPALP